MLLLSAAAHAQSAHDALRMSYLPPFGTARTQALGGAGVGLGGDYTSAHMNPAGIGMFKTGEFLFSMGVGITDNNSTYLRNNSRDNTGNTTNFHIPNIGVIFATNKGNGSNTWNNISFSLGMTRTANFNSKQSFAGVNNKSSYTDTWVDNFYNDFEYTKKNGLLGPSLGYETYLIDSIHDNQGPFIWSEATPNKYQNSGLNSIYQKGTVTREGGINEIAFAMAGNYGDRLYIGASIVVPSINYRETTTFHETDTDRNPNNRFAYMDYSLYLKRTGLGVGGKLGILYKVTDRFRVGAAVHTPTVTSIHDTYSARLETDIENGKGGQMVRTEDLTSDGGPIAYDYTQITPFRVMGGASYFFGNLTDPSKPQGFITADYEYINHASSKFRISDDRDEEKVQNDNIDYLFRSASNIRVGAEVKFLTVLAVRAGFAAYGNPYSNDKYNAGTNGSQKIYSGGLGLRTKGVYADLTYSYAKADNYYQPYLLSNAQLEPGAAKFDYTRSNIALTVGFKF